MIQFPHTFEIRVGNISIDEIDGYAEIIRDPYPDDSDSWNVGDIFLRGTVETFNSWGEPSFKSVSVVVPDSHPLYVLLIDDLFSHYSDIDEAWGCYLAEAKKQKVSS